MRKSYLSLAAMVALVGCPDKQGKTPDGPKQFEFALIHPGPSTDGAWNALANDGADAVWVGLGAHKHVLQEGHPQRFADALRDFSRTCSVVFAHGYEYQDACLEARKRCPGTLFVVSNGDVVAEGVVPLVPRFDQVCYLAGVAARIAWKTGKVGAVGGMALPSVKRGFEAFARGVKFAGRSHADGIPAVTSTTCYLGNWDDVQAGKEQALAMISAGCDVFVHNADHAGLGVFDACREKGALAIGMNRNQNGQDGVVFASGVFDFPRVMVDLCRDVQKGKTPRDAVELDVQHGYASLVVDRPLLARLRGEDCATAVVNAVEGVRASIASGEVDPSRDP